MKLFVYHTPEEIPTHTIPDCAIAVDVLRATTTMSTALAAGAEAIQVFSDLDELKRVSGQWPSDKRIRAGERGGAKVEGFDFGNSPLGCTSDTVSGRRLFISTTNGTRALKSIESAKTVLAAALVNRSSVIKHLVQNPVETVWIVGSGWEGSYSLEDTVCAGAIMQGLTESLGGSVTTLAGNDEAVAAVALYSTWKNDLVGLLRSASHGQRLLRLNCDEDIVYCAQLDSLDVLPIQREPGVLVAQPVPAIASN
ncbi:MAG: 2-phosphosulfolactate phosphatase family protein [Cyanobacteria bacterium J06638_20]